MTSILPIDKVDLVLPMCKEFFAKAKEPGKFNEEFFKKYWSAIYQRRAGAILVTAGCTGMLGFIFGVEMCTGDHFFSECFMYGNGALKLISLMEEIGKESGVSIFYMNNIEFLRAGTIEKIYNRKGYFLKYNRFVKVV